MAVYVYQQLPNEQIQTWAEQRRAERDTIAIENFLENRFPDETVFCALDHGRRLDRFRDRPAFQELAQCLRTGDHLVVASQLTFLPMNMREFHSQLARWRDQGVVVHFAKFGPTGPVSMDDPIAANALDYILRTAIAESQENRAERARIGWETRRRREALERQRREARSRRRRERKAVDQRCQPNDKPAVA